jgi:putative hydrolase of the HAD superfamily
MIQAVLFDLFETLVTESGVRPARASSLGERLGIEPEAFRRQWRIRRPRVILGQLSFADALSDICEALAGRVDAPAVQEIREQRIREKAAVFHRIRDDVAALLTELTSRGVGLGVISNCFEEDVRAWPACGLARQVQCTVFSFAEGVAKPDAGIYRIAARRLGIEPATTVFIGDGGDRELEGAEQAGFRAFRAGWFSTAGIEPSRSPASDLPSTQDVLNLVAAG